VNVIVSTRKEDVMVSKNAKLKKEVWNYFSDTQNIFFATSDGKQARGRPVTLIYFRKKFWVATGSKDAKIKQLKKNKNFEWCMILEKCKSQGYIRASGKVKIIRDKGTKAVVADNIPFFKNFWKEASDPGFALLRLEVSQIEYIKPGKFEVMTFKV